MTRDSRIVASLCALAAGALACNLPFFASATPEAVATLGHLYTAAAQTLAAQEITAAGATPTATEGFPTLVSVTATGTQATVSLCDAATFVKDLSIPDGSRISPGDDFTKTWRLFNAGTCSWTPAYALVFVSGDRLEAPESVGMPGNVDPGETVDLSVSLRAPGNNGAYQGYWKLRNASRTLFGIGARAQDAFWVSMRVDGPTYTAYDFARRYCDAAWENGRRGLPCPGRADDTKGYVLEIEDAVLENGSAQDDAALVTVPRDAYNGSISGHYPPVTIRRGDHFQAQVNCSHRAYSCNVIFSLYYQTGGGEVRSLGHWNEAYEGRQHSIDLDLSSLEGKNVNFILHVSTNGPFHQDRAMWVGPRIARLGSPPNTETPTPTASATATRTSTPTFTATATDTPTPTSTP